MSDVTDNSREILHQAMSCIRNNGPAHADSGICTNVNLLLIESKKRANYSTPHEYELAYARFTRLIGFYCAIASIPNINYPIESSADAYDRNDEKWDATTSHGKARWRMLDTLIDLNGGGK